MHPFSIPVYAWNVDMDNNINNKSDKDESGIKFNIVASSPRQPLCSTGSANYFT